MLDFAYDQFRLNFEFSGVFEDVKAEIWSVDGKLQQTLHGCLPSERGITSMKWNKRDTAIAILLLKTLVIWDLGTDCITGRTDFKSPFHFEDYCWKDEDTLFIFIAERKAGGWTHSIYLRITDDVAADLFKSPPVMVFDSNEWSYVHSDLRVST